MRLSRATSLRLTITAIAIALTTAVAAAQTDASGAMTTTGPTDSGNGFIGVLIIVLIPLFGIAIGVMSLMVDKMLRATR